MKSIVKAAALAGIFALAACGGQGDDTAGDNVADAAEAQADNLEEMADNATSEAVEENLEAQAENLRDAGEAQEEAIDDADVNAAATNGL